jgi:hypothetical protein
MYRVRTVFTGPAGAPWLSTFYFLPTSGMTAQQAVAATGAFWTTCKAHMVNTCSFATEPEVATLSPVTGEALSSTATTPVTGTGTSGGEAAPWATQGLIRWRTGTFIGGREIRGRTFIPGVTEGDNVAGVPGASYITDIGAAAATLIASATSDISIWSRKNGQNYAVSSATVWPSWAVLRSRRN